MMTAVAVDHKQGIQAAAVAAAAVGVVVGRVAAAAEDYSPMLACDTAHTLAAAAAAAGIVVVGVAVAAVARNHRWQGTDSQHY